MQYRNSLTNGVTFRGKVGLSIFNCIPLSTNHNC
jgi:hypothetical protein